MKTKTLQPPRAFLQAGFHVMEILIVAAIVGIIGATAVRASNGRFIGSAADF